MMATQSSGETFRGALWPGIAGIVSGCLMIAGLVLLMWRTPDTGEPGGLGATLVFYSEQGNLDLSETSAVLLVGAGLLFMWFLVALARLAGNRSHLVLVGGCVFTVFLIGAALVGNIYAISASRSDAFLVLPQTVLVAVLLLDLAYALLVAAMVGAAVMLFAMWRVAATTKAVPEWLGWAGLVVAIVSLAGPFSAWLTPLLLAVWTITAGVLLILKARAAARETGEHPDRTDGTPGATPPPGPPEAPEGPGAPGTHRA
ncbi:hypothetical protein [Streptomyces sp. NPDC000410]|uniref:hypothetical protein n=1 Tax=Streptomyces sp. NPDC000410 TaxID=3154254 RepID=UPI003322C79D